MPRLTLPGVADAAERFLLAGVAAAAALGLAVPAAGRAAAAGDGISAALAVLVFSTGLTLRRSDLAAAAAGWRRLTVVLAVSTVALPALAWAASLLVSGRLLRAGVIAAGVAPAEVATVALCAIGGGDAAACAVLLAASAVVTVLAAGPALTLLGLPAAVPDASLLGSLLLIIALPLAAGIALRAAWSPGQRASAAVRLVTVAALLVLLWQVASQVRPDAAYLRVVAALAVFVAASAVLGRSLAAGLPRPRATAVVLPVAMRDFAVAAGIATAAFGPAAAAPLGAYGVLVLLLGAVFTRRAGQHDSLRP
jgi:predicted Na+-dependent transporter